MTDSGRRPTNHPALSYSLLVFVFLGTGAAILAWQFGQRQEEEVPDGSPVETGISIGYFEELRRIGPSAVPELIHWLETGTDVERRDAALAVMHLQDEGREAWDALVANLQHPNSQVRDASLSALFQLGRNLGPLVGVTAPFLDDDNEDLRKTAANVLNRIGCFSSLYALPLITHPRKETRQLAVEMLESKHDYLPEYRPVLAAIIEDEKRGRVPLLFTGAHRSVDSNPTEIEDRFWRMAPFERIAAPPIDSLAMGTLIRRHLDHESAEVRKGAAALLRAMGPGVLPAVIDLLDGTDEESMRYVISLLSWFDRINSSVIQQCRRIFARPELSSAVRFDALALTIASGEATPDEFRMALQTDSPIKHGVLRLFSRDAGLALPYLGEIFALLEESPQKTTWLVQQILSQRQPISEAAILSLRRLLESDLVHTRLTAARLLSRDSIDMDRCRSILAEAAIGNEGVLSEISDLLEYAPEMVPEVVERLRPDLLNSTGARRKRCFMAIAAIGEGASAALPEIQQALDRDEPSDQTLALLAIAGIGPQAAPAIPRLIELLQSAPDDTKGDQALESRIGSAFDDHLVDSLLRRPKRSHVALRRLLDRFGQKELPEGRLNLVLAALERLGPAAAAAAPAIVDRLDDLDARPDLPPFGHRDDWRKRRCALIQTLARIVPSDEGVSKRLRSYLTDHFPEARLWSAILLLERNQVVEECTPLLGSLLQKGELEPVRFARVPISFRISLPEIAAERLGAVGLGSASMLEPLATAVGNLHEDPLRLAALRAVRLIIADAKNAGRLEDLAWNDLILPAILGALHDEQTAIKIAAVDVLELLGPFDNSTLLILQSEARDWRNAVPDRLLEVRISYDDQNPTVGVSAYAPCSPTVRDRLLQIIAQQEGSARRERGLGG